jgi:hypothetical protein
MGSSGEPGADRRSDVMAAEIQSLKARVARLEHEQAMTTHVHDWRYGKTVMGRDVRSVMWWWECADDHVCGQGRAATNHRSGIPDHFPADVR